MNNTWWKLETGEEAFYIEILNVIIDRAFNGSRSDQNLLKKIFEERKWKNVREKLETEGSVWYVWWMDGVRNFMFYDKTGKFKE